MSTWHDPLKLDHPKTPWRRPSRQRPFSNVPKRARNFLRSILVVAAIVGLRRGFADLHDQVVKRNPTEFSSLRQEEFIWPKPEQYVRVLQHSRIGNRYEHIRYLGGGNEGSADLYQDQQQGEMVVIKTFDGVSRNVIPETLRHDFSQYTFLWPTEIEAALLLRQSNLAHSFLLLSDYFVVEDSAEWYWATVSPYSARGTLLNFAQELSTDRKSIAELDQTFRPQFDQLIATLRSLHDSQLCHDDVKPDNIFVQSPEEWLLGDVGNMREISHPWHATRSWSRQNQLLDCRANDIRRMIKAYLWFLRSGTDAETFDREFWKGETSWAKLYWDFEHNISGRLAWKNKQDLALDLARSTERELLCTTIPWRLWKPSWFVSFWV